MSNTTADDLITIYYGGGITSQSPACRCWIAQPDTAGNVGCPVHRDRLCPWGCNEEIEEVERKEENDINANTTKSLREYTYP